MGLFKRLRKVEHALEHFDARLTGEARYVNSRNDRAQVQIDDLMARAKQLEETVRKLEPAVFPAEARKRARLEMRYIGNLSDEELVAMYAGRRI